MANLDQFSTEDLLRIFLSKFLTETELGTYKTGTAVTGKLVGTDGDVVNTFTGS